MSTLRRETLGVGRKSALLVVDATVGFTDPASELGAAVDDVVDAIRVLADAHRARGLPVFFTTVQYDSAFQASVFRARVPCLNALVAGSRWVDIDPRLARRSDESILVKHYASAFFGTDLMQQLVATGADTLFVTGLTTSGCVRASAVDALQHDFRVIVPRQTTGDRDRAAHEANLHDLDAKYADVVDLDVALAMLGVAAAGGKKS